MQDFVVYWLIAEGVWCKLLAAESRVRPTVTLCESKVRRNGSGAGYLRLTCIPSDIHQYMVPCTSLTAS